MHTHNKKYFISKETSSRVDSDNRKSNEYQLKLTVGLMIGWPLMYTVYLELWHYFNVHKTKSQCKYDLAELLKSFDTFWGDGCWV